MRAPASRARAAVWSPEPLSTTTISETRCAGIERTTAPMDSSSFSAGMTAETRTSVSQAPAQAAARADVGRPVAGERAAKLLVARPVPDLAQRLLGRVAEREARVAPQRERGDAAGQRAPGGREVHERPWPPAQRPGLVAGGPLDADLGLDRAGGVELDAERPRPLLGAPQRLLFLRVEVLEERRVGARQSLAAREVDQSLQIDLADAELVGELHETRELGERLLESRQPEGDAGQLHAQLALPRREGLDVAHDALEGVDSA